MGMHMFLKKFTKNSASARGFAQALDLTGAIASRRLREIKSRTVGDAIAGDWARIGGDLRYVTSRWMRKVNG
jgi:hypothetical protein